MLAYCLGTIVALCIYEAAARWTSNNRQLGRQNVHSSEFWRLR